MATFAAATAALVAAATAAATPNVVVLFVDDMGIDQIAVPAEQRSYGYTGNNGTIKTPNIYRLAAEGMVFQNWYSGFHVCTPSRAAMMTGRLPVRSGIGAPNGIYAPDAPGPSQGNNLVFTAESVGGLPLNETTLAEALKPRGYATLCVGKWHLGQREEFLPTSRGFDSYLGIPFSQDIGMSFWLPLDYHGKAPYQPVALPLLTNKTVLEQPADLFTIAQKYSDITTEFITANAESGTPFFVYLPFNHIHAPNSCGAAWCGQSARGPIGDAVEETDWVVGNVMNAIRSSSASTNTLVFFTSDNGSPQRPDGNTPLRGYKGSTWEGGYREPGIAWWPGKINPGSSTNALAATYDIFPTVLSVTNTPQPPVTLDGVDLSSVLFQSAGPKGHDCIFFYKYPHAATTATDPNNLAAVRCDDFKVYWYVDEGGPPGTQSGVQPQGKPLVFNLVDDPTETQPVGPESAAFKLAVAKAVAARKTHIASIIDVPNQNALGNNPDFLICGAPDSPSKYPQYPNCSLTPQYWNISICGSPNTKWCNQTASGGCPADCPRFGPGSGPVPPPPPPPGPPLPPTPPIPPANSVGCFIDHVHGACDLPYVIQGHCVSVSRTVHYPITLETCNTLCYLTNASFKYFATQDAHGCFCGDSYGKFGAAPANDCNATCVGTHEICGGPNRNSVYKIQPLPA